MSSKEKYRKLCRLETNIPIFSKDWWMDAVCGEDNWDILIVEKDQEIIASMPIFIKQKHGFKFISQPLLTQNNGIYMKYPEKQKYDKKLSFEKDVMSNIIDQLKSLDVSYFQQSFHYSIKNWLPFYWENFEQTTKYTYVIDDIYDTDIVFKNFSHAKRKNINKASKVLKVKYDLPPDEFYNNHKMTLAKQNQKILYSYDIFKRIYDTVYKNDSGKTFYAIDENGNLHSAILVIWDNMSAYYLISTIDPDYRNSGSASLLVFEAIKYVSDRTKKFDFEGSMIEGVENSFRQFGAEQKPYFFISKAFKHKLLITLYKSLKR